ncbi:MAG: DUF3048 domain-containing protein [bacterium]|nr:DUF3048 domain-containing protein [bacterium]
MIVLDQKKTIFVVTAIAAIAVLFFVFMRRQERTILGGVSMTPSPSFAAFPSEAPELSASSSTAGAEMQNPLTGERCANALRRPIAVMLSGDAQARPLSSLEEADMVFEMPVITGSITRFMAVYVCRDPIEIGSVRSARHDFIFLARGLDALYAHWGGSHFAMDLLKQHAIDNIDALTNPTGAFWRKENLPAPHNGFTSMTRLFKAARFLQYRLEGRAPIYTHLETSTSTPIQKGSLEIAYAGPFRVRYEYDPNERLYARIRGGITERDRNSGDGIRVRNVVVMRAASRQIEGQYNDVAVTGSGNAAVYRGGEEILGTWKKDEKDPSSKLMFLDEAGNEIPFLPGNIWVEIVEPYTNVSWTTE